MCVWWNFATLCHSFFFLYTKAIFKNSISYNLRGLVNEPEFQTHVIGILTLILFACESPSWKTPWWIKPDYLLVYVCMWENRTTARAVLLGIIFNTDLLHSPCECWQLQIPAGIHVHFVPGTLLSTWLPLSSELLTQSCFIDWETNKRFSDLLRSP